MNTKDKLKVMREIEEANKRHEQEWKEAQERAIQGKEGEHEQTGDNDRK